MAIAIYPHQIKALRVRLGITQAELADLIEVALSTVASWEVGRAVPTGARATALRRLMAEPAQAEAVTLPDTVGTYDHTIAGWEKQRTEELADGRSTGLSDQILRVLRNTRASLVKVASN